ncbi:MAG: tRNA uridine-5-carboxymethylaminomethyl(34) synthesis GTPase MnmE [Pseudomonadota bacterium]
MSGDTIFACATGIGAAGVAIMRVSGPKALTIQKTITGQDIAPRDPSLRRLRGRAGEVIDEALVLFFPSGSSFTGEDVVEFQCHGSPAVIDALAQELEAIGARSAEAGEFTRRAFLNGRMDLAQVEGLSDLVQAETDAQRRQALTVMQGALSKKTLEWRDLVLQALALVAATIDFADEEVPVDVRHDVIQLIERTRASLRTELEGLWYSERVRSGFEVALIGAPNVGKSTLLNALAGRDAAITSDIAGTTRDIVEVRMDLDGLPVTFLDTAGLRDAEDEVEKIGIARTEDRARSADLRIFVGPDAVRYVDIQPGDLRVSPKADLFPSAPELAISGKTGQGVPELLQMVREHLSKRAVIDAVATHQRHGEAIKSAIVALDRAEGSLDQLLDNPELITVALQDAAQALSSLIGDVDVEHILDQVFSRFCIGK